jgi:hypothetical protein
MHLEMNHSAKQCRQHAPRAEPRGRHAERDDYIMRLELNHSAKQCRQHAPRAEPRGRHAERDDYIMPKDSCSRAWHDPKRGRAEMNVDQSLDGPA